VVAERGGRGSMADLKHSRCSLETAKLAR